MRDFTIGQGESIRDTITVDEEGAVSATLVVTDGSTNLIEEIYLFDGMIASVVNNDTVIPPAEYDYYYKILWDDDSIDYVPNLEDCDGECEFPKITICEVPGVS